MKTVIYKIFDEYATTSEQNYYARVRNARAIHSMHDFESAQEIIDYYCKWFGCEPKDFIVIE